MDAPAALRGRHSAGPEQAGQWTGGLLTQPEPTPTGEADPGRPRRFRTRTGVGAAALLGVIAAALMGAFWWKTATSGAQPDPLPGATSLAAPGKDEGYGTGKYGAGGGVDGPAVDGPSVDGAALSGSPDTDPQLTQTRPAGRIVVHVAGAVARPGVLELPEGSRLHAAIAAVGGQTEAADPDRLNLAAVLADGQRIFVPRLGEADQFDPGGGAAGGSTGGAAGGSTGGGAWDRAAAKINLNTAGVDELGTLPRVGPVLAQRIIDWRLRHGGFRKVAELDAVDGIGPKLLEVLLPLVAV